MGGQLSTLCYFQGTLLVDFRLIFFTRHSDLRSGWRVLLFLILLSGITLAIVAPLQAAGANLEYFGPAGVLVAIFGSTFVMTRFINRKPFSAIGLGLRPEMVRELGMGCLLGFLMMAGIFLVELAIGYVQIESSGISIIEGFRIVGVGMLLFALGAMVEEALFRGYVFQTMIQGMTFLPAVIVMSVAFAAMHGANPNMSLLAFVNIGLAAVWLSFAYFKTRSLWLPFGLHFSWNFSQTTLFSFPTSGIQFKENRLFALTQSGPDWLTGGVFGPEGGVLATFALFLCTWYVLKSRFLVAPEGIITLDSVEDLLEPQTGAEEPERENTK